MFRSRGRKEADVKCLQPIRKHYFGHVRYINITWYSSFGEKSLWKCFESQGKLFMFTLFLNLNSNKISWYHYRFRYDLKIKM